MHGLAGLPGNVLPARKWAAPWPVREVISSLFWCHRPPCRTDGELPARGPSAFSAFQRTALAHAGGPASTICRQASQHRFPGAPYSYPVILTALRFKPANGSSRSATVIVSDPMRCVRVTRSPWWLRSMPFAAMTSRLADGFPLHVSPINFNLYSEFVV
jgi:hypothetical protein